MGNLARGQLLYNILLASGSRQRKWVATMHNRGSVAGQLGAAPEPLGRANRSARGALFRLEGNHVWVAASLLPHEHPRADAERRETSVDAVRGDSSPAAGVRYAHVGDTKWIGELLRVRGVIRRGFSPRPRSSEVGRFTEHGSPLSGVALHRLDRPS